MVLRHLLVPTCGLALACRPQVAPSTTPEPTAAAAESSSPVTPTLREGDILLPTRFESDRVFLEARTEKGQPLRMYTDTGGGLYLHDTAAQRLGLPLETAEGDDGSPIEVVGLPVFDPTTPVPAVTVLAGRLPVAHESPLGDVFGDGILGAAWFGDRVWTFDYGAQTLVMHASSVGCDDGSVVPLGFPQRDGVRLGSYPRITVEIDGFSHELLFDTGATVMLTEPGLAALADDGPPERATSFMVRSVFQAWRRRHPDWRVIESADRMAGDPMIEVPAVEIGEHSVGPVWFTARDDPNFHEFMSQWMDKQVDGALGGSALRYLRFTMDYPAAQACLRAG